VLFRPTERRRLRPRNRAEQRKREQSYGQATHGCQHYPLDAATLWRAVPVPAHRLPDASAERDERSLSRRVGLISTKPGQPSPDNPRMMLDV
jgi:hypothetical protein